ncbi:DUF7427 family protein [Rhodococcus rhodochrous]
MGEHLPLPERRKIAERAWLVGLGVVAAYEIACPPGHTLSEGLDHHLEHPVKRRIIEGVLAVTALHLCNRLPNSVDPYHQVARIGRKLGIRRGPEDGDE